MRRRSSVQEVKEHEVIDLFSTILNSSYATQVTTEYIDHSPDEADDTGCQTPPRSRESRRILQNHQTSLDVEVQQRAVEFGNLFAHDQIRRGVLEKMPPPQIKEESRVLGEAAKKTTKAANRQIQGRQAQGGGPSSTSWATAARPRRPRVNGSEQCRPARRHPRRRVPAPHHRLPSPAQSNVASIMDLFSQGPVSTPSPAQSSSASRPLPARTLFHNHNLPTAARPPPPPRPLRATPAMTPTACNITIGRSGTPRGRSRRRRGSRTRRRGCRRWRMSGCRRPCQSRRSCSCRASSTEIGAGRRRRR